MPNYVQKDPEYLYRLGLEYYQQKLFEASADVLSQIPQHHPLFPEASFALAEAYFRCEEYQQVIDICENLIRLIQKNTKMTKVFTDSNLLADILGDSYFHLGRFADAMTHYQRLLSSLPANEEISKELATVQPGTDRPETRALIREGLRIGLTPHVVLDCLSPILWEGRPASACFTDQLTVLKPQDFSKPERQHMLKGLATYLYCRFGIYTVFMGYMELFALPGQVLCKPLAKVFFSLEPSLADQVKKIETLTWNEFNKQADSGGCRKESMQIEGNLLGYPKCCTEWAITLRGSGKSIEKEGLTSLIAEDMAAQIEKKRPPLNAYFAFEFFPCNPRCTEAERIGKKLYANYLKNDKLLAELYYNHILPLNRKKIWETMTPYVQFTSSFDHWMMSI